MILAHAAGIPVFVTGGIGGAHRGAEQSKSHRAILVKWTILILKLCITAMDISADLLELGKTPVAVVCAGAKSILDIPKTLEILVGQKRWLH